MDGETITPVPTFGKLAAALAKAQGAMEGAAKDSLNPFFKSKYADLASVWGAIRKPLSDNGLSVVQLLSSTGDTVRVAGVKTDRNGVPHPVEYDAVRVTVRTRLMHESGEYLDSELTILAGEATAQAFGSAATYGRRYALAAICGVAPEDDDGEAAQARRPDASPNDRGFTRGAQEGLTHLASRPNQATSQNTQPPPPARPPAPSAPQARLKQAAIDNGLTPAEVPPVLVDLGYPTAAKDLTEAQFKHLEVFALVNAGRIKRGEPPIPAVNPDGSLSEVGEFTLDPDDVEALQ